MQYSPLLQVAVARHEEVAWQVSGPPMVSSLQDVKPVTVEQSDVTAQITEKMFHTFILATLIHLYHIGKHVEHHKTVLKCKKSRQ